MVEQQAKAEKIASSAVAQALGAPKIVDPPPPTDNIGRMIITLLPDLDGRAYPVVEFDPVGQFTPGLIERYVPLFAQRINIAQAGVRNNPIEDKESF